MASNDQQFKSVTVKSNIFKAGKTIKVPALSTSGIITAKKTCVSVLSVTLDFLRFLMKPFCFYFRIVAADGAVWPTKRHQSDYQAETHRSKRRKHSM